MSKILVVDDEQSIVDVLTYSLSPTSLSSRAMVSGGPCWLGRTDLVILDLICRHRQAGCAAPYAKGDCPSSSSPLKTEIDRVVGLNWAR
jgi:hypothetical protein